MPHPYVDSLKVLHTGLILAYVLENLIKEVFEEKWEYVKNPSPILPYYCEVDFAPISQL